MTKRQMKHVWKARRVISLVLIVTLVMTGLHLDMMSDSIYAAQKNKKGKTEKQEVSAVKELTGERTENSNTYLMSDGTKKLELFGENIRYKEKGKWRDYDNTLNDIAGADEKKFSAVSENIDGINTEKYAYVNKQGDSKQYFAEVLDQEHPIVMSRDAHVIRFAPAEEEKKVQNKEKDAPSSEKKKNDTEDKNTIEVAADEKEMSASLEKDKAGDNTNKVTYSDDTQDIRYVYTSLNNGVKEEIILNKKPDKNTFTFRYDAEGTEAVEYGGNQILLADKKEGNIIASISAPYVTDAEGNISYDDVHMELKESEDGSYLVELIVEEDYLKDEDNYPVTIDPTVYWDNNSSNINTSDNNPQNSRAVPGTYRFYTGINDEGYEQITYIQLSKELEQVKGKNIHYAVFEPVIAGITGNPVIQIKNTEGSCGFMPLYQGNVPKLSQKTYGEYLCNNERQDRIALYMTDIVRAIAVGEITTYGIALKTKNTGNGNTVSFYGPEEKGNEPILYIGYSENTDVEATYDGSFDISGNGQNENSISLEWEKYDSTDVYQIYARKNEGDFKPIGITYGTDYTYTCPSNLEKIDFRVLAIRKNEEKDIVNGEEDVLSNIISFDKVAGTSEDDNGNEVTTISYEQITRDTDGDGLEDGYEIWDLKTLWNTETADSTEENPVYEMDSDGDGFPDSYEVFTLGTDPAVGNPKDENGKSIDSDGDGFSDLVEYENGHKGVEENKVGTDPHLVDSDFDGIDDKADGEPRYTNGNTDKSVANATEVYIGLYDISYSKEEQGVVYNYIKNIYSGLVKQVSVDYGNDELNKSTKYFYDENGNNTAVIESYKNQIGTICITYSYDEDGNAYYVCDQKTKYNMEYNEDGDISEVSVDNNKLIKYVEQNLQNNSTNENLQVGDVVSVDEIIDSYNNGQKIRKVITSYKSDEEDKYSQKIETYQDDSEKISYLAEYNSNGDIVKFSDYTQDEKNPIVYNYTYENNSIKMQRVEDFEKEVITETGENDVDTTITNYKFNDVCGENTIYTVTNGIEDNNNVMKTTSELFNGDIVENEINRENNIKTQTLYYGLTDKQIVETELQRKSNISSIYKIDNYNNDKTYEYSYDLAGNIKSVKLTKGSITTENYKEVTGELYKYSYDAHGRIISEYDYISDKYYEYKYNSTGNIRAYWTYDLDNEKQPEEDGKVKYFSYDGDWDDQMTKVDGDPIEYDNVGNPINYINGMEFTWKNGHNLNTVRKGQKDIATYQYNQDGLRTLKETEDTVTQYTWDQNKLLREIVTYKETNKTYDVWYIYDGNDEIIGFEYSYLNDLKEKKKTRVYYEKNLLGDIISLLDSRGLEIVTYTYDAWGNMRSNVCFEGNEVAEQLNNIGYRGYYRDKETGFYYLRSRYYDPQTTRFISVDALDDISDTGTVFGYNLYCYCECNPIIYNDDNGNSVKQTIRSATYSYNRKKAKTYMKNNWDETAWNFLYRQSNNGEFYHYTSDCANYVSQCLFAGGFRMTSTWYSTYSRYKDFWGRIRKQYIVSEAWRLQDKQREYFLKYYSRGSTVINKNSNLKKIIKNKKIKKGDIIYFNNKGKGYSHAAIIYSVKGGTIRYSAHTDNYLKKDVKDFFKSKSKGSIMVVTLKDSGEVVK